MNTEPTASNHIQLVNFCKASAYCRTGDYEDTLSQVCNFHEAKIVRTKLESYIKAFGEPSTVQTPGGLLYIWSTWALRIYLMDASDFRIVHFEVPTLPPIH